MHAALVSAQPFTAVHAMRQESGVHVSRRLTLYRSEVANWAMQQLYSPGCTFILAPHETSIPLHPSFIHSVYSSEHWKAEHLRVLHELAYLFHSNQRMAGWRRSKGTRNRTLWEWCTMDSSCSTYRVGKVQSIFSLPVNSYSVIPLFRYSVLRVLPTPRSTHPVWSHTNNKTQLQLPPKMVARLPKMVAFSAEFLPDRATLCEKSYWTQKSFNLFLGA